MIKKPIIAVTAGDVAGIGPEILVSAAICVSVRDSCHVLAICHPDVLRKAAQLLGRSEQVRIVPLETLPEDCHQLRAAWASQGELSPVTDILCWNPAGDDAANVAAGTVSAAAGNAAFRYLTAAIDMARSGLVDAICTAPLNKAALHAGGHFYPGHTEILAEQCGVPDFAMMLHLSEARIAPLRALVRTSADGNFGEPRHGLSIAHVTLHTSVASVPGLLTTQGILEKLGLMHSFLQQIGCDRAAMAVCALNPHGGEKGLFGDEEQTLIAPAVREFQKTTDRVTGPLPVDTLIRRAVAGEFDGVIAMYHDQGHIPIKLMGFDAAVNITLGLPLIRTSPTHGTAFDRAWNPATPADPAGMVEAVLTAARLCESAGR